MKNYIRTIAFTLATVLMLGSIGCANPGKPAAPSASGTPAEPTEKPTEPTEKPAEPLNENTDAPQAAKDIRIPAGAGIQLNGSPSGDFTASVNSFAAMLMTQMGDDWTGIISPLSLQLALALFANGADEETCSAILSSLGINESIADTNSDAAKLIHKLLGAWNGNKADEKTGCIFNFANAMLAGKNDEFTADFKNIAGDYYNSAIGNIDFSNREEALKVINSWVSEQTNGLVDKLFDEISPDTCTALINALYFKGDWKTAFTAYSKQSEFHGTNDDTPVTMLNASGKYLYGSFDEGEMILLPYEGGEYYMAAVLPKANITPTAAMNALMGRWDECAEHGCKFSMPSVDLNSNINVLKLLTEMMLSATAPAYYAYYPTWNCSGFTKIADSSTHFPFVIENADVFITQIVHGAHIKITEKGTEAGAASGITANRSAPVIADVVMTCDRPYAMAIVNAETGAVIFVSVVNNIDSAAADIGNK